MEPVSTDKTQGWKNVLKIIIPYFLTVGIFQLIAYYFVGLDILNYKANEQTTKQTFVVVFFSFLGTILIVRIFRKYVDVKSFNSLGFDKKFINNDLLRGILFGFFIMLLGFTSLILTKQITFLTFQFRLLEFILSIGLFIFVAISEEIFLRGYILSNLLTSFNKYVALFISSLIFSIMHAANPNFNLVSLIGLFVAGLLFGLAYIKTKNLWFPIALHFSWNFFQGTVFGFNVSGKDTYSIVVTKETSFTIWNGGNFGFEGSILSILFQCFAIAIIYRIFRNRFSTKKTTDFNKQSSS